MKITRSNIDEILDRGALQMLVNNKFYDVRRNGRTQLWVRNKSRIYIPIKYWFRGCTYISSHDFEGDTLSGYFRVKPEMVELFTGQLTLAPLNSGAISPV